MFGLFKSAPTPPARPLDPNPACKHLKSTVSGSNRLAYGTCPECGEVNLAVIFNNWLERFRELDG